MIKNLLFLLFPLLLFAAPSPTPELRELDKILLQKEKFVKKKYARMKVLKQSVETYSLQGNGKALYKTYISLFDEYKTFKYDSAYYYLELAKKESFRLKDAELIARARIREGFVLLSSGLF